MAGPIHYELYVRRTAPAPWALQLATESRTQAMEQAESLLADGAVAAVRVTKETLDVATGEFQSITVLNKGAPEEKKKRLVRDDGGQPSCMAPADLYTPYARELIGRVLEDWLARNGVTAFELLHRADLAERLDASGVELQHAIQKVAVPESQSTGQPVHELIRHYQKLVETTVARIIAAGRGGRFPDLARGVAQAAETLAGAADRVFLMGGAVAARLAGIKGARARVAALLDLVDQGPQAGPGKALMLIVIDQVLAEMLARRTPMSELVGPALDPGGVLAATVLMVAPDETAMMLKLDPRLAADLPTLEGPAARLADRIATGGLPLTATLLARQMMRELTGPRRLRPRDASAEISILRSLATLLTATGDRLLTVEEVQNAFVERSKALVAADFVAQYTACFDRPLEEAEALLRLCENVTGLSSKRSAGRWLVAALTSLRLETEMLEPNPAETPSARLARLAALQRGAGQVGLAEKDAADVAEALAALGGAVEAKAGLAAAVARSRVAPVQKLTALLRMAVGEAAPLGPAADRAKAEALKLLRAPETRSALAAEPGHIAVVRPLLKAAGLAA